MENAIFKIEGMSCEHCAKAITETINGIAGASEVLVDLKDGTASFNYDPAKTSLEIIKAAIIEEGYTVTG
jgi:copper chaperone